jgi:hypothetical protein
MLMPIDIPLITGSTVLTMLIFFAFVWNLTQKWRKSENALNKPLTITLRTEKTPAELIAEANAARIKRWFTYLVVMFVVWGFLKLRYPGLADIFESLVFGILTVLVHGLAELFSFLAELLE